VRRAALSLLILLVISAPALGHQEPEQASSGAQQAASGSGSDQLNPQAQGPLASTKAKNNPEAKPEITKPLVGKKDKQLTELDNDLYLVKTEEGYPLLTHGPELKNLDNAAPSIGFRNGDMERDPVCASDYYQQIIYAVPTTRTNRYPSMISEIRSIIKRMNAVLNADATLSGGVQADYKVNCSNGEIDVKELVYSGSSSFSNIVSEARRAGFDKANVNYSILTDNTSSACGVGSFWNDDRLTANNYNNRGGGYAITYWGCWYNETPMHENGHNMGAVQEGAPHSTGTGAHCWDEYDVMCYSPDGGSLHQQGTVLFDQCLARNFFDCNYNDYFNTSPLPGSYLAAHWNIGSRLNRFITFTDIIADRDGDGVPDSEDLCPDLAGSALSGGCPDQDNDQTSDEDKCPSISGTQLLGCPEYKRSIKIAKGKRKIKGSVNSIQPSCRQTTVTLYRTKAKKTSKFTKVRSGGQGKWTVSGRIPKGSYFARVQKNLKTDGICLKAKSKKIKLSQRM
jgi:hypothetical protein